MTSDALIESWSLPLAQREEDLWTVGIHFFFILKDLYSSPPKPNCLPTHEVNKSMRICQAVRKITISVCEFNLLSCLFLDSPSENPSAAQTLEKSSPAPEIWLPQIRTISASFHQSRRTFGFTIPKSQRKLSNCSKCQTFICSLLRTGEPPVIEPPGRPKGAVRRCSRKRREQQRDSCRGKWVMCVCVWWQEDEKGKAGAQFDLCRFSLGEAKKREEEWSINQQTAEENRLIRYGNTEHEKRLLNKPSRNV